MTPTWLLRGHAGGGGRTGGGGASAYSYSSSSWSRSGGPDGTVYHHTATERVGPGGVRPAETFLVRPFSYGGFHARLAVEPYEPGSSIYCSGMRNWLLQVREKEETVRDGRSGKETITLTRRIGDRVSSQAALVLESRHASAASRSQSASPQPDNPPLHPRPG